MPFSADMAFRDQAQPLWIREASLTLYCAQDKGQGDEVDKEQDMG